MDYYQGMIRSLIVTFMFPFVILLVFLVYNYITGGALVPILGLHAINMYRHK